MKIFAGRAQLTAAALAMLMAFGSGCSSIAVRTHEYLGAQKFAPTTPESVQILEKEPEANKTRLGEIIIAADGEPKRDAIEKRIRTAAAKLGADAVFIVYDRTHLFPVVYADGWGPTTVTQGSNRNVVGIAVKYLPKP